MRAMLRGFLFVVLHMSTIFGLPELDSNSSYWINCNKKVELKFYSPLDLTLDYSNCNNLFDTTTCANLQYESLVLNETALLLRSFSGTIPSELFFNNVTISETNSLPGPNADCPYEFAIRGPKTLCHCNVDDDIHLSINWMRSKVVDTTTPVAWYAYEDVSVSSPSAPGQLFTSEIGSQSGSEITIQSKWFTAGKTYRVFAEIGTVSRFIDIEVSNTCEPNVDIEFNSRLLDSMPIIAKGQVRYSACKNQDRKCKYDWVVVGYDLEKGVDTYSDLLVISPKVLGYENSTLFLRYEVNNVTNEMTKNKKTVSFINKHDRPQVLIRGGDRTVGRTGTLYIETLTVGVIDEDKMKHKWSCVDRSNEPCVQASVDISFPNKDYVELYIGDTDILNNMEVTFTHMLEVNGDVISRSSIKVKVLPGSKPQAIVKACKKPVSVDDEISLMAEVFNVYTPINYEWSCYYKYDSNKTELLTGARSGTATPEDSRIRKIMKNLDANNFSTGRFLICTFSFAHGSETVYGSEEIEIGEAAKSAVLFVTPSTGYTYKDHYRFRVSDWDDIDIVFSRCGYYTGFNTFKEEDKVYLQLWSSDFVLENIVFSEKGKGAGDLLNVFCEIKNEKGFVSVVHANVAVMENNGWSQQQKIDYLGYDFDTQLNFDQFSGAKYIEHYLPQIDALDLPVSGSIPSGNVQAMMTAYLKKFMRQGFLPQLVEQAIDVIRRFVMATEGRMHNSLFNQLFQTYDYITNKLMGIYWEVDAMKITTQMFKTLNMLLNYLPNVTPTCFKTTVILKTILQRLASQTCLDQIAFNEPYIEGLLHRESFYSDDSGTVLTLSPNVMNKYKSWKCSDLLPHNCTGIVVTQVKYDMNLFPNGSFGEDWRPVSHIYDVHLFNPVDFSEISTMEENEFFDTQLPLTDLSMNNMSNVQCQVWNEDKHAFDPDLCYFIAYTRNGFTLCRCSRLGRMVALFQEGPLPTTESPILDPDLSFKFFFYFDFDPYCSTVRRKKQTLKKFSYQIWDYILQKGRSHWPKLKLPISRPRFDVYDCEEEALGITTISMNVTDKLGEVRSWFIKQEIQSMIYLEEFQIVMKQGGNLPLFDANQTTPPPVYTIPPIEEVTTNWIPIIVAILVFLLLFLLLATLVYWYHTKLLKENIFTDVNCDPSTEETEEEKLAKADKKSRIARLNAIHLESLENTDDHSVLTKKDNVKNKIGPVGDKNAMAISDPYFVRDTPDLDADLPRYALDDSDSEDPPSTSLSDSTKDNKSLIGSSMNSLKAFSAKSASVASVRESAKSSASVKEQGYDNEIDSEDV